METLSLTWDPRGLIGPNSMKNCCKKAKNSDGYFDRRTYGKSYHTVNSEQRHFDG